MEPSTLGPDLSAPPRTPVCDLVLLTWNRADLLIPCVERILRYTDVPCRLMVVDNASTEAEAVAYLDLLSAMPGTPYVDIEVIRRSQNDGFAIGMNEGLAHSRAPWICLLNNDILVTSGWLSEMLQVAQANSSIGLLNPMSNEFNVGPMQVGSEIEATAARLRARRGTWIEHCAGVGFCLLIPRRVYQQIGGLDTRFRFMYYEDQDYSFRVRQAGFLCAIAQGAYVFHAQRSGMKRDPSLEAIMRENEARFFQKWGTRPQRVACVLIDECLHAPESTRRWLRELANASHQVWVFASVRTRDCVPQHFEIFPRVVPRLGYLCWVVWPIMTKKKRFHQIIVCHQGLGRVLRWLRPLHRAEVVIRSA